MNGSSFWVSPQGELDLVATGARTAALLVNRSRHSGSRCLHRLAIPKFWVEAERRSTEICLSHRAPMPGFGCAAFGAYDPEGASTQYLKPSILKTSQYHTSYGSSYQQHRIFGT